MKVFIKISIIIFGFCMMVCTTMIFFKGIKILFTRESAAYLSDISNVNYLFSVLFFTIYVYLTILIFRKVSFQRVFILLLVFSLWFLSGRVLAFKAFPNGRVITGWYYIQTDKFKVCQNDFDCESVISNGTSIKKMPFWRINISNKYIDKTIFIGPFTWNNCTKVFESHIGK